MSDDSVQLPAFPLGSVLLPGMALPLRIFEPRYRQMIRTVLDAEPYEFVVVLIERGSEVGGGETRADVGCVAQVVEAREYPDGQWAVLAVGTRRVRVDDWLPDDPHPVALVHDWPDETDATPGASTGEPPEDASDPLPVEDLVTHLELRVLQLASLGNQLGLPELADGQEFSSDLSIRVHQLATIAPIGAHDRLRLLRVPSLVARVELLEELVEEQELMLEARRLFGDEGGED